MKVTIDIPDELYRRTKATASLQGRAVKELVADALREKLDALSRGDSPTWRQVFGAASREATDEVDAVVASELEAVDPESWK